MNRSNEPIIDKATVSNDDGWCSHFAQISIDNKMVPIGITLNKEQWMPKISLF